jgi:hypothetical protein
MMKMKRIFLFAFALLLSSSAELFSQSKRQAFYEIKVYHYQTKDQEVIIDDYLRNAFLPAVHRHKIAHVGVFKPIGNDTAHNRRIYVLIPFKSARQFADMPDVLNGAKELDAKDSAYLNATHNKPAYRRVESIFLKAFAVMPNLELPALRSQQDKRIYELRSYEGPTETYFNRKVQMFNEGGEAGIFKRLGFNAVFYGSVIAGSRMPNLMYMTSFDDMASRDEHWKAFRIDAEWKKLSSQDYYKNTVSKSEIILLHPTEYSEI